MKIGRHFIFLFLLLLEIPLGLSGQDLWHGIKSGASISEIRKAFPSIDVAEHDSRKNGTVIELSGFKVNENSVFGETYDVLFTMDMGRLSSVSIRLNTEPLDGLEIVTIFDSLLELLRYKYGNESSTFSSDPSYLSAVEKGQGVGQKTRVWLTKEKKVRLECRILNANSRFLSIEYSNLPKEILDRL